MLPYPKAEYPCLNLRGVEVFIQPLDGSLIEFCTFGLHMTVNNCITDFEKYTNEEIKKMGVNDSGIHVDFMIGSKDLNITGYTRDGKKVQIFKNGNWAF